MGKKDAMTPMRKLVRSMGQMNTMMQDMKAMGEAMQGNPEKLNKRMTAKMKRKMRGIVSKTILK